MNSHSIAEPSQTLSTEADESLPPPPFQSFLTPGRLQSVKNYIADHWQETVRSQPSDSGTLLGLPHSYTVPCCKGAFQEIYYWDTYFTCLGLIESGRVDLALSNTRNLLSQVERFGFVPNGNRTYYMTRSQPPYLAALVSRVAETPGNGGLIQEALPLLEREYQFWIEERMTPAGLSHYGQHASREELIEFHAEVGARAGLGDDPAAVVPELAQTMSECESGWDFTPRFEHRCADFCAVDLNCLLYLYELFFADHGPASDRAGWLQQAEDRKRKINQFCWDEERGGYFDYDHVNDRRSSVASTATFQALWAELADGRQASVMVEKILPQLEFAFGVAACNTPAGDRPAQWAYPNGWPCLQYIVSNGLRRYGFREEADRVAGKYLASLIRSFEETGELWEKYNVADGSIRTFSEKGYSISSYLGTTLEGDVLSVPDVAPAMMGWTAGVYMALLNERS